MRCQYRLTSAPLPIQRLPTTRRPPMPSPAPLDQALAYTSSSSSARSTCSSKTLLRCLAPAAANVKQDRADLASLSAPRSDLPPQTSSRFYCVKLGQLRCPDFPGRRCRVRCKLDATVRVAAARGLRTVSRQKPPSGQYTAGGARIDREQFSLTRWPHEHFCRLPSKPPFGVESPIGAASTGAARSGGAPCWGGTAISTHL
jgi:hypothetical protein